MSKHLGRMVLPLGRVGPGGSFMPLGTCFAVGPRKFASAAHVTGPSDDGLMAVAGRVDSLLEYQDTTNQRVSTFPLKIVGYVPLYDIVILERLDITITLSDNFHVLPYSIEGSDLIPTGTPVMSLGFPHAGHGRLVLTQQSTMVGARVLLGSGGLKIKHVVLNTQTRPGQSGGPVFSADGKRVCAMILGGYSPIGGGGIMLGDVDPQTLHQTTHAVSAEYISEVL